MITSRILLLYMMSSVVNYTPTTLLHSIVCVWFNFYEWKQIIMKRVECVIYCSFYCTTYQWTFTRSIWKIDVDTSLMLCLINIGFFVGKKTQLFPTIHLNLWLTFDFGLEERVSRLWDSSSSAVSTCRSNNFYAN